jgi:hypothetical protein
MESGLGALDKGNLWHESEHNSSNKIHYYGKYLRTILPLSCVLKRWAVCVIVQSCIARVMIILHVLWLYCTCYDCIARIMIVLHVLWFGDELKLREMTL